MVSTQTPPTDPSDDEQLPPAAAPGSSTIVLGAGHAAWLSVVTVIACAALILAYLAMVRAGGRKVIVSQGGAATTDLTVEASEFAFDPATAAVPAGVDFSVTLDNVGQVDHNWTVLQAGSEIESEADYSEDLVLLEVPDVAGGSTRTESFSIADPGSYQIICTIAGHFDAGMAGTLTVQ